MDVVIGIDLGGTSTKFGIVNAAGNVLCNNSIPTNSNIEYRVFFEELIRQTSNLAHSLNHKVSVKGIGIGAPDANSMDGHIHHPSNLSWPDKIPVVNVVKSISDLPTTLENDANAAAIGEHMFGAAREMKDFIVITLGTGLGSGIVIKGELVLGHDSHAGELGHTNVYKGGRKCGCGNLGCLEAYVSAIGLVRTVKTQLKESNKKSLLRSIKQIDLDAKKITEAAKQGDLLALQAFDYTAEILGSKLADFIAFSSPEAIIFSGGLSKSGDILFKPVKKYMEENVMKVYKNKVKIITSDLMVENAAILGAAASIWQHLKPNITDISN